MIVQEEKNETIASLLSWATERFSAEGFESAELEARYLLSGFLGTTNTGLILNAGDVLAPEPIEKFRRMVDRRINREPAAYILGNINFVGNILNVDRRVLIPRPETELLVEEAFSEFGFPRQFNPHILDVGTGSGCISIALAQIFPSATILAVDNSLGALKVAQVNIRQNKMSERISLLLSDGYEGLPTEKTGSFDMIVSNPPYIASPDLAHLEPELSFEPREALDGGPDGLCVIHRLIAGGRKFLKDKGVLMLEIGYDQGVVVRGLLKEAGYQNISVLKDYGGNDRIAKGLSVGPV